MGLTGLDHELLQVRRGARSGAYTIVAVHSTALGPALGGCRLTTYPHPADAVADALRLAEGMTLKAAVAGVDLGGGKKGMTVRFTLHPQAQWADGTPITSKDVAFSWSVGVKPESGFARPDPEDDRGQHLGELW